VFDFISLYIKKGMPVYLFVPWTFPHRCTYLDQIWHVGKGPFGIILDTWKRACGLVQANLFPHYMFYEKGIGIVTKWGCNNNNSGFVTLIRSWK
jgi:hypothetical protein